MKIWKKLKSSPNIYRKGKFDQMWPSLTLTSRQQKKVFRPNERFFARELKKSISLNIKIKTLKSYFNSKEVKSLNSILLKKTIIKNTCNESTKLTRLAKLAEIKKDLVKLILEQNNNTETNGFLISKIVSQANQIVEDYPRSKVTTLKKIKPIQKRRSRNYVFKLNSLFLNKTFKSIPNYANEVNFLFSNIEQKKSIFNDILALKSGFLAPGVLRIRKLQWSYALKLKAMNRIRLLLGIVPLRILISIFKKSQKLSNFNKVWKFIGSLESLLPSICLKIGFSTNILKSLQWIQHSKIGINGKYNGKRDHSLFPGDFIHLVNEVDELMDNRRLSNKQSLPIKNELATLTKMDGVSSMIRLASLTIQCLPKDPKKVNEFTYLFGRELHSFFRIMWNFINHRYSVAPFRLFYIKQKRKGNRRN